MLIEPLLLGDLVLDDELLGELLLPEDDELGEVLELPVLPAPEELPLIPEEVLPEAPLAPEPCLAKYASHSARETLPSLLVSASEKLGVELLLDELELPPAADGEEDGEDEDEEDGLLEEPVELLPDDVEGEADGLFDDDEDDCATARLDSAKSTAAAMMLRDLGMNGSPNGG